MTKGRFFCSTSAIAALLALGAAGQAQAQAQTQAAPNEITEVVVTGSFIRGTPEDAALPVDVISQEDLEKQGSPSTLELIKTLSVSSGVLGDTNQFDTRAQGSEGSGSINLRGLGAARTLVLMNGRRMPTNPFAAGVVDTNILPQAAIGRVEILKDGAAATYGSDAIGGVVNFITRTNFEGLEVGGSYTHVDGSKGNYDVSALWGMEFDNGNIMLSGGWQHRSELKVSDRSWALRPFAESAEGGWSGGTSTSLLSPIARNPATGIWGLAGAPSLDAGCAAIGNTVAPAGTCRFQYTAFDNLIEGEDRYQIYGEANFDLNDNHSFHAEILWARTDVPNWKTSPSYLTLQTPTATTSPLVGNLALPAAIPSQGWFVPAENPGYVAYRAANPTALPAAAQGVYLAGVLYRPFTTGGIPIFEGNEGSSEGLRQYESYRVSAGFKGDTGFMGIGYDVALTYGQEIARRTGYDSVTSRLQLAMRGFGSLASDPNGCTAAETNNFTTGAGNQALGCYWFNPFSNGVQSNALTGAANPGFVAGAANNPDLVRWFFPQVATKQASRSLVADAVLNGTTGIELAGGDVAWAAGVQFRRDVFESDYSPFTNIGENPCVDTPVTGSTACTVRNGVLVFLGTAQEQELERQVYAGFAELAVPITDDLQLQLAVRYEDYEAVGSTTNYKATGRWQAAEWLAFRGSIGSTFRGPNLTSLTNSSGTALSFIAGSFRAIDTFGNPNLDPETADTYSAGVIFNVGRFKATVDYWRFDFKDPLVIEPSGSMVNTLFSNGVAAPGRCAELPGLASRFTFQGSCLASNIARVRVSVVNGPKIKTSGFDLLADYDFGDFMGGELRVGASATYTLEYKIGDFTVEGVVVERAYDAAGFLNYQLSATSLPEWKGSTFVEYSRDRHNLRFTLNYIDSYVDQRTAPFTTVNAASGAVVTKGKTIKSTLIAELDYRVELPWDTTATLSIDNLFDRDPSFARLDLNYDPFTGSAMGRTFKLSVKKRF